MIITCSQCSTQYYLAYQELTPDGRKLKCSKCKTIWFQNYIDPPDVTLDAPNTKSLNTKNDKIFLPAVIEKKLPIWNFISIAILSFIILGLATIFFQDTLITKYSKISKLYDKLGIPSVSGMKIHAVEISNNKHNQIDINAIIANNSKTSRRVSPVIIFLFDKRNTLLKTIFIPAPPKYLNPGSKYAFYKKIQNNFKAKPKAISVALANGTEVFLHFLDFK